MKIIFLDTETTGLENGRIIQLAYKKQDSDDMLIEYYKPPIPIEFEAMGTHHITEKMVSDKQPFSDTNTYKILPELLKDSVLVAHNAKFDIGILKNEGIETHKFICTLKIAQCLYDELPNHKLQTLRYRWGVDIENADAHDAGGDVMVLEKVFDYMVKEYCVKNNVNENEAVEEFIDICSKPMLLKKINFGKYINMPFSEIKESDPNYFKWLSSLEDKDEDFKYTINYYLNKPVENIKNDLPF